MQGGHDPPPLRGQPGPSANRWPSIAPSPSAHPLPSTSNSPPGSSTASAPKRKAPAKPRKKAKEDGGDPDGELDSAGSGDDDEGGRRAKRARMALSCKECKRRKIRCDRNMPVCGMCDKRGRPSDCTWDLLSTDAGLLPPTIARTADVDALTARLTHIEAYLRTLPPNLASFVPYAPQADPHPAHPPPRKAPPDETFSDTEDAAVLLENGVFGTRPILGPDSPEHSSLVLPRDDGRRARESRFGARGLELTKALTSIVALGHRTPSRAHLNVEFDATAAEVDAAAASATQRILRALPPRAVVRHLVNLYFTRVSWLFHHLHAPSFLVELDAFYSLVDLGRSDDVDVFWLALLLMVICVALDSTHASRSPLSLESSLANGLAATPLSTFSDEQLRHFPEIWFQASQAALALGSWESVPRVRSVQVIILFTQYLQLCSSSRGQPSQLVVWLAGAIKIAQVLGLHLLGSNPEVMPVDDPAWPPGRNSMKRESAKRLWACLVYQDWVGASSKHRTYLISPLHFDTDDPSNLNDSDLSPIDFKVTPPPSNILTDSTADRVRVAMARQARKVFDAVVLRKDLTYETVLELDRGFREILDSLPDQWTLETTAEETEQPMLRYQRHFAGEGLHNRILRLHRPFLHRGWAQEKYRYSTDVCIKSARVVIVSTHNIRDACRDIWFCYSHVMGAALVLFADLFQAIDSDLSAAEIDAKRSTLVLAAQTFSQSEEIASPSLKSVVQQGSKILEGLFRAEEARRDGRAAHVLLLAGGTAGDGEDDETFAEVLQRISRSLATTSEPHRGTPPPTRGIPSAASSTFRLPTYPTFPTAPDDPTGSGSVWPFPLLPSEGTDGLSLDFYQDLGGNDEFWSNSVSFMADPQVGGAEDWEVSKSAGGTYELPDQFASSSGW